MSGAMNSVRGLVAVLAATIVLAGCQAAPVAAPTAASGGGATKPGATATNAPAAPTAARQAAAATAPVGTTAAQPTAAPQPAEKTKVTIALGAHLASFYPITVAAGAGYFEQEGLDAELVLTGGGGQTLAAVSGGSADLGGVVYGDAMVATSKGQRIVSVASLVQQYTTDTVMSATKAKELGISPSMPVADRIKNAKGLKIAVSSRGSGQDKLVRYVLKRYGVDPDNDVTIVAIQNAGQVPALQAGQVDVFANSSPISDQGIASGGVWWFRPSQGEIPDLNGFVYTTVAVRPQLIQEKPQVVQAAVKAIQRALQLIHTDEAATLKILQKYAPNVSEDLLKASLKNNLASYPTSAVISEKGFQQNLDFLAEFGEKVSVKFEDVTNVDFAKRAAGGS